jgi:hypothetical protein
LNPVITTQIKQTNIQTLTFYTEMARIFGEGCTKKAITLRFDAAKQAARALKAEADAGFPNAGTTFSRFPYVYRNRHKLPLIYPVLTAIIVAAELFSVHDECTPKAMKVRFLAAKQAARELALELEEQKSSTYFAQEFPFVFICISTFTASSNNMDIAISRYYNGGQVSTMAMTHRCMGAKKNAQELIEQWEKTGSVPPVEGCSQSP